MAIQAPSTRKWPRAPASCAPLEWTLQNATSSATTCQQKLPFVIKAEVLNQAQGSLQSFWCLKREREMEKLLGGNLRALLWKELSEEAKFSLKFVTGVKAFPRGNSYKSRSSSGMG